MILIISGIVLGIGLLLLFLSGNNLNIKILGVVYILISIVFGFFLIGVCVSVKETLEIIKPIEIVRSGTTTFVKIQEGKILKTIESDSHRIYLIDTNNLRVEVLNKYNSYGFSPDNFPIYTLLDVKETKETKENKEIK